MSFEIHLNIAEDSQRGELIASLTAKQNITPSQAVEKIIDNFARSEAPKKSKMASTESGIVAEAVRKAFQVRDERTQELATMSARNESAAQLIGFLQDEPEVVDAIREAGNERRQAMYN